MRPPESTPRPTRTGPDLALRRARAEAAAAEQAVAAASAQRLKECLGMTAAERIRHLDDPDLVQADRVSLGRSLEASLVPERRRIPFPRLWRRGQWSRRARAFLIRATLSPLMIGLIIVGGPWLYVSWQNTRPIATLTQRGLVAFRLPDGREDYLDLPKGMTVTVFDQSAADPVIGQWYSRLGYATAAVPRTSLQF